MLKPFSTEIKVFFVLKIKRKTGGVLPQLRTVHALASIPHVSSHAEFLQRLIA